MRISTGWHVACAVLCVCAYPSRDRFNEIYIRGLLNPKSTVNGYGFEQQLSATKLFEILEDSEEFEEKRPSTMRAIVAKSRSRPVLLPLIIEPEAEMLPVGYEGVKPPGVTHMELTKPQISPTGRKSATPRGTTNNRNSDQSGGFNRDNDAHYAASKHETQVARDDRGTDSLVIFEVGVKDDTRKENENTEYTEAAGVSKSHSENKDRAKNHKEEVTKKKGATYEINDDRKKAHNAAGYRNVYHKDEFKKDADFYSNGREGGHFEKHGRYDEKHAVVEGKYTNGETNGSRFVEMEANKRRKFEEKTRDN